jgi:hypothetical protein
MVQGSGVQGSAQPPAKKTAGQIEKETLKKRISNNESSSGGQVSNVEVMYSIYFIKMTERSDSILRHSIFDILRFCGSLFKFVSYKVSGVTTAPGLKTMPQSEFFEHLAKPGPQ